jgi:hypothetical protein
VKILRDLIESVKRVIYQEPAKSVALEQCTQASPPTIKTSTTLLSGFGLLHNDTARTLRSLYGRRGKPRGKKLNCLFTGAATIAGGMPL